MNINRRNQRFEEVNWNLDFVILIWLDDSIDDSEQSTKIEELLFQVNNSVQFYTNANVCFDLIRKTIHEKIVLIISDKLYREHISEIGSYDAIYLILVLRNDKYSNSMFIDDNHFYMVRNFNDEKTLIQSINDTIHILSQQTLNYTLFDVKTQKSMRDVGSAFWFRLLLDILKHLPYTEQSKNDMLNKCTEYYQTYFNQNELRKIDDFRQLYHSSDAIQWYTTESFLYRLLNKALRTEDIDLLYTFRFYIIDLSHQLEREHRKQIETNENWNEFDVFRGQIISTNEFNNIATNSNVQISMNSFMSTTKNRNVALTFVAGYQDNHQFKRVLFKIRINPKVKSIVYADISQLSLHRDEEEVLFDLGIVLKIISVVYDNTANIWTIEMVPIDGAFQNLSSFYDLKLTEMKTYSSNIVFGRFLFYELGQTEKAHNYFQSLLNSLPIDHEDIPSVYHNIGSIYRQKGELKLALKYYLQSYSLRQKQVNSNQSHIASSLRNIGLIHYEEKDYDTALKYLQDSLSIEKTIDINNRENETVTMVHIGMAFNGKKEFTLALEYLLNAYEIYCRILPKEHPDIGWTASNIGQCYEDQQNYDQALYYYYRAYKINENILNSEHPDLTFDLNKIVNCHLKKHEYEMALQFCQNKLTEQQSSLNEYHPRIGHTLQTIGYIYQMQSNFETSLSYYKQALVIFENHDKFEEKSIIQCEILMSELYLKNKFIQDALDIRLQALLLQEKYYSSEHVDIAESLLFIGKLYKLQKNFNDALEYLEKSLKIFQANYQPEHINVQNVLKELHTTRAQLLFDDTNRT